MLMLSLTTFFQIALWQPLAPTAPHWRRGLQRYLQLGYGIEQKLVHGDISLHAMSLVYTTLLSLAPLLAVSFSVLKAFGIHNQVEPLLAQLLAPLGDKGSELSARIVGFVENMQVGVLGAVGLVLLFYTVFSLLHKIDVSFNSIWHNTKPRSLVRTFTDYISVVLLGPVLVFSGIAISTSMMSNKLVQQLVSIEPFGTLYYALGLLLPYVLIIAAFFLLYLLIPNTQVRWRAAALGAVIGGILWKTVGWGFATFVATSTQYDAIYSSFAILVLFIIWLYLSWLMLLIGAQLAFFVQHPHYLRYAVTTPNLSHRQREYCSFQIMMLVARRFVSGEQAHNLDELSREIQLPLENTRSLLAPLLAAGLLVPLNARPMRYVPGKDIGTITLGEIWTATRAGNEGRHVDIDEPLLDALFQRIDTRVATELEGRTLRTLMDPNTTT